VNLTRAMYARMRGHPPKVIVNILGTGADKPQWRYACGTPANIALLGLTKVLGGRSIDDGIRVVAVSPGAVETERWRAIHMQRAREKFGDESRWREALLDQPQNRAAKVEEVANVVVFLASDRAGWVCGEAVTVDGGRLYRKQWFKRIEHPHETPAPIWLPPACDRNPGTARRDTALSQQTDPRHRAGDRRRAHRRDRAPHRRRCVGAHGAAVD